MWGRGPVFRRGGVKRLGEGSGDLGEGSGRPDVDP